MIVFTTGRGTNDHRFGNSSVRVSRVVTRRARWLQGCNIRIHREEGLRIKTMNGSTTLIAMVLLKTKRFNATWQNTYENTC